MEVMYGFPQRVFNYEQYRMKFTNVILLTKVIGTFGATTDDQ